jgi:hypothetical protein
MPKYYDYCDKFVWLNDELEDWEVTWEPASWAAPRTPHHKARCKLLYHRAVVFWFRFHYVLNFEHFTIYVSLL